jgi:hypothetical protein
LGNWRLGQVFHLCRPIAPMLLHVIVGDLIRDALIAESFDQPIKDRRGLALPHCRSDTISIKVSANLLDQARGTGETANPVDHPDRMIDRGCLVLNFGTSLGVGPTSPNCRRSVHAQISDTSLR